ncbi:MAG: hypothetical protein OQK94_00520 [Gammaproteobacteria bacterium]|nr:hypothetical protein [Gammaproteobacteria bacterium]MCW8839958.1 hypothetical protein [Gammaproteobacteria bacterium]MCW8959323.1 hypothetical protein [Gammaproteobacteria bacterium]MCW8993770.1 hypothetical protein [Gammaproteobacteria bacterium]
MDAIVDWIKKAAQSIIDAIIDAIQNALGWLWEVIIFLPKLLWDYLGDAVVTYVEEMEVPTWMENASNLGSVITPEMAYFMQGFALAEGLAIIGAALLLRFILRRIPIIG